MRGDRRFKAGSEIGKRGEEKGWKKGRGAKTQKAAIMNSYRRKGPDPKCEANPGERGNVSRGVFCRI